MTHTNFSGDWINSCTVIASIFIFKNGIFMKIEENEKMHVGSEKSINSIKIKKDRLLEYKLNNYFFTNFLITFRYYYCTFAYRTFPLCICFSFKIVFRTRINCKFGTFIHRISSDIFHTAILFPYCNFEFTHIFTWAGKLIGWMNFQKLVCIEKHYDHWTCNYSVKRNGFILW